MGKLWGRPSSQKIKSQEFWGFNDGYRYQIHTSRSEIYTKRLHMSAAVEINMYGY